VLRVRNPLYIFREFLTLGTYDPEPRANSLSAGLSAADTRNRGLAMASILVVDDDELARRAVRSILECAEHHVEEAGDGASGLAVALRAKPDLVLSDILMPRQDGIELILQLRQAYPECRIIAISGGGKFDPGMLLDVARALGANDYLAKPFGKAALLAKVEASLGTNLRQLAGIRPAGAMEATAALLSRIARG
jgi:CheY-like chemotaxis protein